MTQQDHTTPRDSRLADQPPFRPVGPLPAGGPRPSFAELMAQRDERDYGPLGDHLDADARAELGLPDAGQPLSLDKEGVERVRRYFLERSELAATLPDQVRDLINL